MRAEEILDRLDKEYPDKVTDVSTTDAFLKRKIQRELIEYIRLMVTPQPKKGGK